MKNPTAAALVIGDEILSGRTRDANMHHLAKELARAGVDLLEVRFVPDDQDAIVWAVNELCGRFGHVITSGGIGPTHDDITADSIAAAFGVSIDVRADARAILEARYAAMGVEINAARLRMAHIPAGAILIENPVSGAPGFSIGNVHVLAGVPAVFQAMLASVLPKLDGGPPVISQTLRVAMAEGDLAAPLGEIASAHPQLSFGSYPYIDKGAFGASIVVRGRDGLAVGAAMAEISALFGGSQT